ncbi:MAG TPA: DNA mismatch repair endonuclease MutL, partial [Candidatus Acidoferrales bacterium]|nr:DNA mismatch repair endonuclease MutL [Candidatus Acidoferrales bacterium]
MSRIRILPEAVANQIAAGEVVERPASVVKELLENALDAGARSIRIETEAGGKRLIRITDDGSGMAHDDALLAFERHATSKLRSTNDLLSIATLGFRGEALPSIAAISRLVLETRAHESTAGMPGESTGGTRSESADGTRIEFAAGKLINVKPVGVPPGTSISVSDIFYCVPARRKFLKSETTELGHIASLVTHYALAHPECQFLLKTPTQEILNVAPAADSEQAAETSAAQGDRSDAQASTTHSSEPRGIAGLAERVYQLFGRQALDELFEIPAAYAPVRAAITEPELESAERASLITVSGFASRPQVQRPNRNGIYIFVNRRLVRDRLLLHAIHEAYRNVIPPGVYPVVLLFLDLPYEEVDVNVHPAKIEVRFRHPQFVHDYARDVIRQSLSRARPIASLPAAQAGFAAAAGANAAPQPAVAAAAASFGTPSMIVGAAQNSPLAPDGVPRAVIPPMAAPFNSAAGAAAAPYSDGGGFELTVAPLLPEPQRFQFDPGASGDSAVQFSAPQIAEEFRAASRLTPANCSENHGSVAPDSHAPEISASAASLATLKPLGQVSSSFIVAINGEGLWIIDQHVAHERILFEQHLRARREGQLTGQRMLMPLVAALSPRQEVIYAQIAEEL